jgi:hypothetical protein
MQREIAMTYSPGKNKVVASAVVVFSTMVAASAAQAGPKFYDGWCGTPHGVKLPFPPKGSSCAAGVSKLDLRRIPTVKIEGVGPLVQPKRFQPKVGKSDVLSVVPPKGYLLP